MESTRQVNKKLASQICSLTKLGNNVLSFETLQQRVPSMFTASRCLATTKENYNSFNTSEFVEYMAQNGFYPIAARQQRIQDKRDKYTKQVILPSKDNPRQNFQKHAIVFRKMDVASTNGLYPQIYLVNSHDGGSSFQLYAGIFRVVCSNGLIVSDSDIDTIRLNHYKTMIDVKSAVKTLFDKFTLVFQNIERMQNVILTESQKLTLANFAASLRDNKNTKLASVSELLTVNREVDNGNDLWSVFNSIQENLLNGNVTIKNELTNKTRKAKAVNSIDATLRLNQALWHEVMAIAA